MFAAEVLRILDANANRAAEGLRVAEEYVRFVLNEPLLSATCKQLRHDLATALTPLGSDSRRAARDTDHDVGTALATSQEASRSTPRLTAEINLKRAQEALRVLEEYAKIQWPAVAHHCEQLRYRAYTLEKQLLARVTPVAEQLAAARLYVLIDGLDDEPQFAQRTAALVEAGVDVLQLRDKRLDDRRLLARARQLRQLTRGTPTLMIMNDRPDLALLAEADGVHVGQDELTVADVRRLVGPQMAIGVSTHAAPQVRQAVLDGADYLGCGPTFPSRTKHFTEFAGLDFLRQVVALTHLPAFAIGGITQGNLPQVLGTGMTRVAVSQAVWNATDPGAAARELRAALAYGASASSDRAENKQSTSERPETA